MKRSVERTEGHATSSELSSSHQQASHQDRFTEGLVFFAEVADARRRDCRTEAVDDGFGCELLLLLCASLSRERAAFGSVGFVVAAVATVELVDVGRDPAGMSTTRDLVAATEFVFRLLLGLWAAALEDWAGCAVASTDGRLARLRRLVLSDVTSFSVSGVPLP